MKMTSIVIKHLDDLFGDISVSKQTTLEALEEIQSEIEVKIDALKEDIKREESETQ